MLSRKYQRILTVYYEIAVFQAEDFYSLNEEVAAAAAAATAAGAGGDGEASDDLTSYTSPEADAADPEGLVAGVLPPAQGAGRGGRRGGKANKFNLRG